MLPIAPLMIEHRLIERLVAVLRGQLDVINATRAADVSLIDDATDFVRTYADRCHHGKEEGILFRALAGKPLPAELKRTMAELVAEHVEGRKMTARLVRARQRYANGQLHSLVDIADCLRHLVAFYPGHIEKEDKHFFIPVMEYFAPAEQDAMLAEMLEFDRKLIHERYTALVKSWEEKETGAD